MMKSVLFFAMMFSALSSQAISKPNKIPLTNLGLKGNQEVRLRYDAYLAAGTKCTPAGEGKKILLTGFGLFSGVSSNISGALMNTAGNKSILPDQIDATTIDNITQSLERGIVSSPLGVDANQRTLIVNNEKYNVCFLTLDVQWDFAAAIIVTEAQAFNPEHIFMFGQGSNQFIIEGGAQNSAVFAKGFTNQGAVDPNNLPIEEIMFTGLPDTIPLTVNQAKVGTAVADTIASMNYKLELPPEFRPSNDYICNNVTYSVQTAANNEVLKLAGGEIVLEPQFENPPVVSFIHLPIQTKTDEPAKLWLKFLTEVIASTEKH